MVEFTMNPSRNTTKKQTYKGASIHQLEGKEMNEHIL
jgi:hypothetical protein